VNDEEIVVWFAETVRLGRVVTRLGQQGERIVADWPGLGRLVVDRFGSTPDYKPAAGAPPELTDKLRLGAARALVGYLRGEVTLHTAAVANGSAGLLFLGDSGVGKSTLAFAMGARKPWSFLSDDLLRLVGVEAIADGGTSWLDASSREALGLSGAESKSPTAPERTVSKASVRAAVKLAYGPLQLRPLKGATAASTWWNAMLRIPLNSRDSVLRDLDVISDLQRRIPLFELRRPKGLIHLGETVDFIDRSWERGVETW